MGGRVRIQCLFLFNNVMYPLFIGDRLTSWTNACLQCRVHKICEARNAGECRDP
jgi:hypothetical protein